MAYNRYQGGSVLSSIFLWLFLIVLLSGAGFFLLDILGIYSVRRYITPYVQWTGLLKEDSFFADNDPFLLEKERIEKRELAVMLQQQEILKAEVTLALRRLELEEMANELTEQQKNQMKREDQFAKQNERYVNENANLRKNAGYLLAMSPQEAVARLEGLEDAILIAHLRMAEQVTTETNQGSMVPVWLSMLPAEQASRIIKKMQLPSA